VPEEDRSSLEEEAPSRDLVASAAGVVRRHPVAVAICACGYLLLSLLTIRSLAAGLIVLAAYVAIAGAVAIRQRRQARARLHRLLVEQLGVLVDEGPAERPSDADRSGASLDPSS